MHETFIGEVPSFFHVEMCGKLCVGWGVCVCVCVRDM
jgi:hypothetical protein